MLLFLRLFGYTSAAKMSLIKMEKVTLEGWPLFIYYAAQSYSDVMQIHSAALICWHNHSSASPAHRE